MLSLAHPPFGVRTQVSLTTRATIPTDQIRRRTYLPVARPNAPSLRFAQCELAARKARKRRRKEKAALEELQRHIPGSRPANMGISYAG